MSVRNLPTGGDGPGKEPVPTNGPFTDREQEILESLPRRKANCLITIANFGKIRVKATKVTHGMSVVAYNQAGYSRRGNAFYPTKRTSGSFELDLVFVTHKGYRGCAEWLESYVRWVSNPKNEASPARVVIPSRKFDKVALLGADNGTGITYGRRWDDVTWGMTLLFTGSRDPVELDDTNLSKFVLPKKKNRDISAPYLYPAGNQLTGDARGLDTVWSDGVSDAELDTLANEEQNINEGNDPPTNLPDPPGGATW